jgi:hypothetical protein
MEETFLDDNPRLRMSLGEDLTLATELKFYIRAPSGAIIIKTCTVESMPLGIVYYDVQDLDFTEIGLYRFQCRAVFTTKKYKSKTNRFKILDAYE